MKLRTKVAALGVAAASIATAGVVYAAWTSTAAGTGSAASTTSQNGDITGVTPIDDNDLYPGATKSAFVTISNPNDYPIIVTKIWAGSSQATTGGCVAGAVRTDGKAAGAGLTRSDDTGASIPGGESGEFELTVRMSNTAADNCKSQAFTIGDDPADDGTDESEDVAVTTNLHAEVESAATGNDF